MISEKDNSTVEEILKILATGKLTRQEKIYSWGKVLVFPKSGESFLSWVMRQAWAFGVTPGKMIQSQKEYWRTQNIYLDLPKEPRWILTLDVLPLSMDWNRILKLRGLNTSVSELQLDISRWFDLSKEPKVSKDRLENYYNYTLRYCPECWKAENNRYFKISWRLPFVLVCPDHGVELKEYCPSCGNLLFDDQKYKQASVAVLENFKEEWLARCRHCGHSLVGEKVEANLELARLQNKIISVLFSNSYWTNQEKYIIFWHNYQANIKRQKIDGAEARLKFMEIILGKPPLISYLNPNYYSQELIKEIERRLHIAALYLSGTPARGLAEEFDLTEFSIRTFAKDLLTKKPFDEIVKRQIGHNGRFGLELAQAALREFKHRHGQLPKSRDMGGIRAAISEKEWIPFGISTWNELMMKTFREINSPWGIYTGEQGLNRAMAELRAFRSQHGRMPINTDENMGGIVAAINDGEWVPFGVKRWNHLLLKTFGETNLIMGIYKGAEGLRLAITQLKAFKIEHNRPPKTSDRRMGGINQAIKRREWANLGIFSWNDLLLRACGEINGRRRKYVGEKGLKRAMQELRAFKAKHGRSPRNKEKEMHGIVAAIRRKAWAQFGVITWNDLLLRTLGSINQRQKESKT